MILIFSVLSIAMFFVAGVHFGIWLIAKYSSCFIYIAASLFGGIYFFLAVIGMAATGGMG